MGMWQTWVMVATLVAGATAGLVADGAGSPESPTAPAPSDGNPVVFVQEPFTVHPMQDQVVDFTVPDGRWNVVAQLRMGNAAVRDFELVGPGDCADGGSTSAVFIGSAHENHRCGIVQPGDHTAVMSVLVGVATGTITVYGIPVDDAADGSSATVATSWLTVK